MIRLEWFILFFLLILTNLSLADTINNEKVQNNESYNYKNKIPLEDLEVIQSSQNIISQLDDLKVTISKVDRLAKNFEIDCLKVVGNNNFCHCLAAKLPAFSTFPLYVEIITHEKKIIIESIKNENIDIQETTIDKFREVRNECVNKLQ